MKAPYYNFCLLALLVANAACSTSNKPPQPTTKNDSNTSLQECIGPVPFKTPLISNIYTADPSAHVFDGKIYIYPSHDLDDNPPSSNQGDHFGMKDYRVFSLNSMQCGPLIDHGEALNIENVPWAQKQMWAPDAAFKNGTYFLYFPAKDKNGIFRIGVAASPSPTGPFTAQPQPIPGSYSIDPAVFVDDDGTAYMYFGGLWGGQLQNWRTGAYSADGVIPGAGEPALGPRIAKLTDDMLHFDGDIKEAQIVDPEGNPIAGDDWLRFFFEGAWMHKYKGQYYLSYSTGPTHYLVYATSDKPTGPFTYRGRLLNPVKGWTTHHSIVEYDGAWYIFYHDSSLSGEDNKRCIKVAPLTYNADGSIKIIDPD
ncbi:MAG: glycoside hydrolase family 43 protein [Deltaproteobacteria bacterium]|nr:glycoside hydrolase family 43 protein [Deltaproteobacteria bacterium]